MIFENRCKLFRYDKAAKQNKERGIGVIQVKISALSLAKAILNFWPSPKDLKQNILFSSCFIIRIQRNIDVWCNVIKAINFAPIFLSSTISRFHQSSMCLFVDLFFIHCFNYSDTPNVYKWACTVSKIRSYERIVGEIKGNGWSNAFKSTAFYASFFTPDQCQ